MLTSNQHLSGYRNLDWVLFSFRSLRALLPCLMTIFIELLIFNALYEIFLFFSLGDYRAFDLSSAISTFHNNESSCGTTSLFLTGHSEDPFNLEYSSLHSGKFFLSFFLDDFPHCFPFPFFLEWPLFRCGPYRTDVLVPSACFSSHYFVTLSGRCNQLYLQFFPSGFSVPLLYF